MVFDIETSPLVTLSWRLGDAHLSIDQLEQDWFVMGWAAKWFKEPDSLVYKDQRNKHPIEDDKSILKDIWKLLDEADSVLTHNGDRFDQKKLNARFAIHGLKPPSPYKKIDTLKIAKRHFGFTSNKLEYLTKNLCLKYKKLKHQKYPGIELWKECLKKNLDAWKEMEIYCKHDVLSLEELYTKLQPWDTSFNPNVFDEVGGPICMCGSTFFYENGYFYSATGKYKRWRCKECGANQTEKRAIKTVRFKPA